MTTASVLTEKEQDAVRAALHFLRVKCGTWRLVATILHVKVATLAHIGAGHKSVSANLAFVVARTVGVPIDDLLTARWPTPGTCPRCGHRGETTSAPLSPTLSGD
jgi:hypothetical protein